MNEQGRKACFLTLGCKVNQAESEALAQLLAKEGYENTTQPDEADVIVINTCTVTGTGSSKSRKLIRKIAKEHPLSTLVVMGCYAQISPQEVAELEGVNLVVGTQERGRILDYLKGSGQTALDQEEAILKKPIQAVKTFGQQTQYEELSLLESENKARAILKIQDGCSQFCTYCIIPYARGPSRSRQMANILAEASQFIQSGYLEIVLTGIHIGAYGKDLDPPMELSDLLAQLVWLPGIKRLRLGSIEPLEFTEALLDIIATSQVICPHFHIPLQSGSDEILARMKRPYTTAQYRELLKRIRLIRPEAAIGADIMTGFPGEGEKAHEQALAFVESCHFAGLHVFPYSQRTGTPAAEMPDQIPKSVKTARVKDLLESGDKSREAYIRQFIGRPLEVLLERVAEDGSAQGHTPNYLELRLPSSLNPGDWQSGQLVECIVKEEYLLLQE